MGGRSNPSGTMYYPKQLPVVPFKIHLKIFLDSRTCQQIHPPIKNTRTFITWKGSPRNYRIASKKRIRIFRSPSNEQQTLERIRAIEKIKNFKKISTTGKKKKLKKISQKGKKKKKKKKKS